MPQRSLGDINAVYVHPRLLSSIEPMNVKGAAILKGIAAVTFLPHINRGKIWSVAGADLFDEGSELMSIDLELDLSRGFLFEISQKANNLNNH